MAVEVSTCLFEVDALATEMAKAIPRGSKGIDCKVSNSTQSHCHLPIDH